MTLTPEQLRLAIFCAEEERLARQRGKPPGPQSWNDKLIEALATELAAVSAVSPSGQQNGACVEQLGHENWIGTQQAAAILRWHPRTVRRRYTDLDGRKVAGALVFRENVVREYAEGQAA